jgi:hypothetical protein
MYTQKHFGIDTDIERDCISWSVRCEGGETTAYGSIPSIVSRNVKIQDGINVTADVFECIRAARATAYLTISCVDNELHYGIQCVLRSAGDILT